MTSIAATQKARLTSALNELYRSLHIASLNTFALIELVNGNIGASDFSDQFLDLDNVDISAIISNISDKASSIQSSLFIVNSVDLRINTNNIMTIEGTLKALSESKVVSSASSSSQTIESFTPPPILSQQGFDIPYTSPSTQTIRRIPATNISTTTSTPSSFGNRFYSAQTPQGASSSSTTTSLAGRFPGKTPTTTSSSSSSSTSFSRFAK